MSAFRLALLSLLRRPLATFIGLVAICVAVASSGLLLRASLLNSSRFSTMVQGPNAVVGAKEGGIDILLGSLNAEGSYPGYLPWTLYESLQAMHTVVHGDGQATTPHYIRQIAPFLYFAKLDKYRVVGTGSELFAGPLQSSPRDFQMGDWEPGALVLGAAVAESLRLSVGAEVEIRSWGPGDIEGEQTQSLPVSGILSSSGTAWDYLLFTDIETAQNFLAQTSAAKASIWGAKVLNYFIMYIDRRGFSELKSLINERTVGQVILVNTEVERLRELTGTTVRFGWMVITMVILLGGLTITTLLMTRFEAMSVHIAVLRALGYSSGKIGAWLVLEGLLLALLACIFGAILDGALFPYIRSMAGLTSDQGQNISIWKSFPVWLAAIGATVVAVLVPLLKILKQDVNQALRS